VKKATKFERKKEKVKEKLKVKVGGKFETKFENKVPSRGNPGGRIWFCPGGRNSLAPIVNKHYFLLT
jgi:hypothetical protein